MVELVITIGVVIWFARMAKIKGQNVFLWGALGAISYYVPQFIIIYFIVPFIVGPITPYSSLVTYFGVTAIGCIVGIICCLITRRLLIKAKTASIEHVISVLKNGDLKARRIATEMLYHAGDMRVVEVLIMALQDADYQVRINAAKALQHIRDDRAILPLISALCDEHPDVRRTAANGLGFFRDVRAIAPLIPLLAEPDPNVRDAGKNALRKITGQNFAGDKKEWESWMETVKGPTTENDKK